MPPAPSIPGKKGLVLSAASAHAGPTYTFSASEGSQPSNVGVITLTQVNNTTVDVLVDLSDTSLPLPEYGFINSGGPHTPFAFTLAGSESGISASFILPAGGTYSFGMFSLSTNNGDDTPYGTFGISMDKRPWRELCSETGAFLTAGVPNRRGEGPRSTRELWGGHAQIVNRLSLERRHVAGVA